MQEGYDAVILGHTHLEDMERYGSGDAKKTYINTGNLFASYTYGEYITGKGFSLENVR